MAPGSLYRLVRNNIPDDWDCVVTHCEHSPAHIVRMWPNPFVDVTQAVTFMVPYQYENEEYVLKAVDDVLGLEKVDAAQAAE